MLQSYCLNESQTCNLGNTLSCCKGLICYEETVCITNTTILN